MFHTHNSPSLCRWLKPYNCRNDLKSMPNKLQVQSWVKSHWRYIVAGCSHWLSQVLIIVRRFSTIADSFTKVCIGLERAMALFRNGRFPLDRWFSVNFAKQCISEKSLSISSSESLELEADSSSIHRWPQGSISSSESETNSSFTALEVLCSCSIFSVLFGAGLVTIN